MDMINDIQENYTTGFIKLFRSLKDKGWYKKSEYVHLWIHILIKVTHTGIEFMFNGKNIKLNPGQFITGRKMLSNETGINESKIERILNFFEKSEQQIEQQKTNKNRLITVLSWSLYQNNKQQSEQQLNNKRTTSEQQVNTYKNDKKEKNEENEKNKRIKKEFTPPLIENVILYFKENGYTDVAASKAFRYYNVADWHDSKGNKIKSWKQKMQGVWFKDENLIGQNKTPQLKL